MKPPKPTISVRPRWQCTVEESLSYSTRAVMSAFRLARSGAPEMFIQIPGKAPSANAMYAKQARIGARGTFFLDKSVTEYRDAVAAACWRKQFVPRGTVGAIILLESEDWVTKKHTVREKDADNPVKVILDALQIALQLRDELVWEFHVAKLFGRREMTHVWLFDLGEVIPALGAQPCQSPALVSPPRPTSIASSPAKP